MSRAANARCPRRTAMAIAFVAAAYAETGRWVDSDIEVMQLATWLFIHQGAQAGAAS